MALNVKLLRRVKNRILKEPRQFIMESVYARAEHVLTFSGYGHYHADLARKTIPNCGTAACIAGWTEALALKTRPSKLVGTYPYFGSEDAAGRRLGLDDWYAGHRLFRTASWPEKFQRAWDAAKTHKARAKVAADRIEHFIKTNGEE